MCTHSKKVRFLSASQKFALPLPNPFCAWLTNILLGNIAKKFYNVKITKCGFIAKAGVYCHKVKFICYYAPFSDESLFASSCSVIIHIFIVVDKFNLFKLLDDNTSIDFHCEQMLFLFSCFSPPFLCSLIYYTCQ